MVCSFSEGFDLFKGCIFLINLFISLQVPSTFQALLNIVKQTMSQDNQKGLMVFGSNPKKWQNYLLQWIDRDELPLEFGGNKITLSNNDF